MYFTYLSSTVGEVFTRYVTKVGVDSRHAMHPVELIGDNILNLNTFDYLDTYRENVIFRIFSYN